MTQQQLADAAGMPPDSGRQTIQIIESRDSKRTQYAWALAKALGVRLEWLLTGEEPMEEPENTRIPPTPTDGPGDNIQPFAIQGERLKLPLVSMVQAGEWCTAEDPYPIGEAEDWLLSPFDAKHGDILLRVSGDSMHVPDGSGYSDGEIIHVKHIAWRNNDDVIARTPDGKATFKRLKMADGNLYLEALNPNWPEKIIKVPEGTVICGVVVGSWRDRRR